MIRLLIAFCLTPFLLSAETPRTIHVFVALCDNATQGIQPVPPKIGNGDDPASNLYWGCSDALPPFIKKSPNWSPIEFEPTTNKAILSQIAYENKDANAILTADAYRGSEMKQCLADLESTIAAGTHDLVIFIGHNGLMEIPLPTTTPAENLPKQTDVAILCCLSHRFFHDRITALNAHPILLTSQLMYPGGFLVTGILPTWLSNGTPSEIRTAAGRAYATNQGISAKAGEGIFSELD